MAPGLPSGLRHEQFVGVLREVETAADLLRAGLDALHRLDSRRFYRAPMMLIAQGLERLSKVAIALDSLHGTGRLPSRDEFRNYGHGLMALLVRVVEITQRPEYAVNQVAREDAAHMLTDSLLPQHLAAIQAYGDANRYHDLDAFLGYPAKTTDPAASINGLELELLERHPEWSIGSMTQREFDDLQRELSRELTTSVLRFGRAVARPFFFSQMGDAGRMVSGPLASLVKLRDEELAEMPQRWRG